MQCPECKRYRHDGPCDPVYEDQLSDRNTLQAEYIQRREVWIGYIAELPPVRQRSLLQQKLADHLDRRQREAHYALLHYGVDPVTLPLKENHLK